MVVLDNSGMFTSGSNQYLQPDFFHGPPTLDSKKSPLALLAQTCSQIGADNSSKPIAPAVEKAKSDTDKPKGKTTPPSSEPKLAFKPYEIVKKEDPTDEKRRSPSSKSVSPAVISRSTPSDTKSASVGSNSDSPDYSAKSTKTSTATTSSVTTPIVRSGLEMLQGHPKDLPLGTYRPGLFPPTPGSLADNPLLRPLPGPLYPPSSLSAAANLHSSLSPYVGYTRIKTATGGETLVPVCRDPYCTGCPLSMHHAQLLSNGACPAGCAQCDHQKALTGLGLTAPGLPPVTVGQSAYSSVLSSHRPYICNWIAGEAYCGKRFATSDELLQHLRTHTTNLSASDASALNLLNPALGSSSPLLTSPAGLHRTYPSLSPLSDLRYHPYSKPGLGSGALPTLPPSPIPSLPSVHPGLGAYYPYSLYGQRLGPAVHP